VKSEPQITYLSFRQTAIKFQDLSLANVVPHICSRLKSNIIRCESNMMNRDQLNILINLKINSTKRNIYLGGALSLMYFV